LIGGAVPDCNRCASPPMLIGLLTGGCAKGLLIYQVSSLDMLTAVLLPKPSIMRARTGNDLISEHLMEIAL